MDVSVLDFIEFEEQYLLCGYLLDNIDGLVD